MIEMYMLPAETENDSETCLPTRYEGMIAVAVSVSLFAAQVSSRCVLVLDRAREVVNAISAHTELGG